MPSIADIVWSDLRIENPPVASLEHVREWEKKYNYTVPEDYREIVRFNQGKCPELSDLEAHRKTQLDLLHSLFHFEEKIDSDFCLGSSPFNIQEYCPGSLEFCYWGGNIFAFDFGTDPHQKNPPIVYWEHEEKEVVPVVDSFTELLTRAVTGTLFDVMP